MKSNFDITKIDNLFSSNEVSNTNHKRMRIDDNESSISSNVNESDYESSSKRQKLEHEEH
jgi:hypothetical protein